ncbi:MAG: hypothetical protein ACXWK7_19815 [Caulobacteraceae bacterium]
MWDALAITEEEAAGLSELAAHDLAMARDFAARAQAETDPDTANDLARSYQRMARSYRQSLALKVRLARELIRLQQDAPPPPRDEPAIRARVHEVRNAARRVIWAEHEVPDWDEPDEITRDACFELLEERLQARSRDDRFAEPPLDDHILEVCAALGLSISLARRWRDLPDPPDDEPDDEADRRSSG